MRFRIGFLVACAALIAVSSTLMAQGAGGGQPQRPPENLKVFPPDTPRQAVVARMREFTLALGVRCDHCHVSLQNTAADDKPEKETARAMIRMVENINKAALANLPKHSEPVAKVDCVTCHRGMTVPTTLQAMLSTTVEKTGVPAAIQQYRDLRAKEAYSGKYDFTATTLTELARLLQQKNPEGATAVLQLALEMYPEDQNAQRMLGALKKQ